MFFVSLVFEIKIDFLHHLEQSWLPKTLPVINIATNISTKPIRTTTTTTPKITTND